MTTLKHTLALHRLSVMKNRLKSQQGLSRTRGPLDRAEAHMLAQERHNAFLRNHLDDALVVSDKTMEALQGLNKSVAAFLAMAEKAVAEGG